jgi:hypothetical protein
LSFWSVAVIMAATAIPMLQVWRRRERLIHRELARRENQARIEAELPLLNRCIDLLIEEYGADTFARDMLLTPPASDSDRRSYVRTLIAIAQERWQVTPPPINVSVVPIRSRDREAGTFASISADWIVSFDPAGKVTHSDLPGWELRIDPRYLHDDLALSVIVAHEFAHGVLGRDGVALPGVADNEVLTDIAAALSGFGRLMLNLQRRVVRGSRGKSLTWSVGGPGYLWPPALEHIIWRHKQLLSNVAAT